MLFSPVFPAFWTTFFSPELDKVEMGPDHSYIWGDKLERDIGWVCETAICKK